ncbi:MAG: penicillin-binding protein 1A [Nitrospirota bacterium]
MTIPKRNIVIISIIALMVVSGTLIYTYFLIPDLDTNTDYVLHIHSDEGESISEIYRERRYFIPHHKIPDHVMKAFIAIEDRRFYAHNGFDIKGILRALHRNIAAGTVVEGGSTITQQLAKLLLKNHERRISRKIKEMFLTARLELTQSKNEILGMYLNLAYFGERAYGIEAAARTYFNKSTDRLTIAEAALLAALQKAPNRYSPIRNTIRAEARRKIVLNLMKTYGFITKEEYDAALEEPLPREIYVHRRYEAPYFAELLRQQLGRKYGAHLYTSGFHVYSTIDTALQSAAEQAVRKGVRDIEMRTKRGVQAALVAIDMHTGAIKAMVGGTDFKTTQFNRATMALRQPGSAFKPFVYAAALERGMSCTDRVLDIPISLPDPDKGGMWSPKNHSWAYYGNVTLKTALSLSLNAATVRLAHDIGMESVCETAMRCGIRSTLRPRPSAALGTYEVTLLDLTASYIALATGKKIVPLTYTIITDRNGKVIERTKPLSQQVFPEHVVKQMKVLLRAVVESGTGGKALSVQRTVYGKTGTTDDASDAWFIGFDDTMAVGVWVGRDDHTTIGYYESGSETALPIWVDFMRKVKH